MGGDEIDGWYCFRGVVGLKWSLWLCKLIFLRSADTRVRFTGSLHPLRCANRAWWRGGRSIHRGLRRWIATCDCRTNCPRRSGHARNKAVMRWKSIGAILMNLWRYMKQVWCTSTSRVYGLSTRTQDCPPAVDMFL